MDILEEEITTCVLHHVLWATIFYYKNVYMNTGVPFGTQKKKKMFTWIEEYHVKMHVRKINTII